jgi:hypothetical protein
VTAQADGDTDRAACLWRSIFGEAFLEPPGGCDLVASGDRAGAVAAGVGIGLGTSRPRPIKDAPQG